METLNDNDLRLIISVVWDKIVANRAKGLGDFSDESQPLWDLKRKLEKQLYGAG